MEYEDRLLCFVDILGFKEKVEEAEKDTHKLGELHDLLSQLNPEKLKTIIYGNTPTWGYSSAQTGKAKDDLDDDTLDELRNDWPIDITQFSDSFVISCPSDNPSALTLFLGSIEYLIQAFFEKEILLRGGISRGKVIHNSKQSILFGTAMNKAYFLESQIANYPRIIISSSAYSTLHGELQNTPKFNTLIREAEDGFKCFDIVSLFEVNVINKRSKLDSFINTVSKGNTGSAAIKVGAKYNYLINRYNKAFSQNVALIELGS